MGLIINFRGEDGIDDLYQIFTFRLAVAILAGMYIHSRVSKKKLAYSKMSNLQRIKRYGLVLITGISLFVFVTYYLEKEGCCLEQPSQSGKMLQHSGCMSWCFDLGKLTSSDDDDHLHPTQRQGTY